MNGGNNWKNRKNNPLLAQRRMEVGMLVVFVGGGTEGPAGEIVFNC